MRAIVITPLGEKNGFLKVHFKRQLKSEIKYITITGLREEIDVARQYCQNNNYRLILNYTGSPDLPIPNKELKVYE